MKAYKRLLSGVLTVVLLLFRLRFNSHSGII